MSLSPAPWQISYLDGGSELYPRVSDAQDKLIAYAMSREDARLIAAAPALLEALKTTRGNIASLGPAGALEPYTPYQPWLKLVDEVIALAEGKS